MWVFTTIGFFSAVKVSDDHARKLELPKHNDPWVMVRARVRQDIENVLAKWYERHPRGMKGEALRVSGEESEIIEWKGRDYPYRVIMTRTHWADLLAGLGKEIDYPNFKDRVTEVQGAERHNLYGRVWGVMHDAEGKLRKMEIEAEERQAQEGFFDFDADDPDAYDFDGFFGRVLRRKKKSKKKKKR